MDTWLSLITASESDIHIHSGIADGERGGCPTRPSTSTSYFQLSPPIDPEGPSTLPLPLLLLLACPLCYAANTLLSLTLPNATLLCCCRWSSLQPVRRSAHGLLSPHCYRSNPHGTCWLAAVFQISHPLNNGDPMPQHHRDSPAPPSSSPLCLLRPAAWRLPASRSCFFMSLTPSKSPDPCYALLPPEIATLCAFPLSLVPLSSSSTSCNC